MKRQMKITLRPSKFLPEGQVNKIAEYTVVKVTNTTDYAPGQVLPRSTVTELCYAKNWTVTVVDQR